MKALVGIISNDAARFSEFWSCVLRLKIPAGSVKENVIGGDWCSARNELAQRCLDEDYDYLWFMDDDHSFGPDLLQKLLEAAINYDLPIVNPLCTTRTAPFHLVTFAANPDPESTDRYLPISLEGLPGEGIVELEAGGCAGMLIRRDVLEATDARKIPQPIHREWIKKADTGYWFEYGERSEDIVFCEKAKKAGFKIHADLSARLGHITTAVVMPGMQDGEWITGVTVGRDLQMVIPRAEDLIEQQEELQAEFGQTESAIEWTESGITESFEQIIPPAVVPAITAPIQEEAERIEIWYVEGDEFMWWWRAIGHDGRILWKDSAINEPTVIAAAESLYPGALVHQIGREEDDSRNLRQYGVPGRMWNRDVG